MISDNYFNVYNASAGTGKTFCLVRDYLILILNSNNIELYKKILAITFTNKAVNEMKGRIISYLINYSNSIDPDKFMINEICDNTNKTKEEVFLKSSKILKNLLKNYGAFEISTIDKFTQKIVRNFTYELGIDSKYEVEIDQNEIPSDIQLMISNEELGAALLRIVQVIGQDDVDIIDADTMYFIISTLNQLNVDFIRNKILLKVLPLKV